MPDPHDRPTSPVPEPALVSEFLISFDESDDGELDVDVVRLDIEPTG